MSIYNLYLYLFKFIDFIQQHKLNENEKCGLYIYIYVRECVCVYEYVHRILFYFS